MKKCIVFGIAIVLGLMFSVDQAQSRGNQRATINQKWRQMEDEQEKQDRAWRRIERSTEMKKKDINGTKVFCPDAAR
ncbi:hypothetical protein [Desulfomonile tiedjei]|uniref:Secreted protein n=1 Tax=Desulfomonile tiedjei (strain ATCC 49306 / DSM 6799 / DCB-1) TaxID=706587 RepID=I4C1P5_DESTA|nr:hypothetical protein [Desulfomonile tiedjei]AFM23486.1 hypothetical protein Desti_0761 [Desulfomonile tiedjei DSM 6799]